MISRSQFTIYNFELLTLADIGIHRETSFTQSAIVSSWVVNYGYFFLIKVTTWYTSQIYWSSLSYGRSLNQYLKLYTLLWPLALSQVWSLRKYKKRIRNWVFATIVGEYRWRRNCMITASINNGRVPPEHTFNQIFSVTCWKSTPDLSNYPWNLLEF